MMEVDSRSRLSILSRHLASRQTSSDSTLSACYSKSSREEVTLKYQDALPKFPVPPLRQTLDKYLQQYQPHVSKEEYERAKKVIGMFGRPGGTGELLQKKLEERRDNTENWVSDWWRDSYLKDRVPNVLHTAPGMLIHRQSFKGVEEQIEYAAFGIAGIASMVSLLARHQFPPIKVMDVPYCMDQCFKSLCSCRVPGRSIDSIFYHPVDRPDGPRHMVVMRNNHFFKFDILDANKMPIGTTDVLRHLQYIVRESQVPGVPIGLLTSLDRDTWADLYTKMKRDPTNAQSLLDIQSSAFIFCLDETEDFSNQDDKYQYDARWSLCGGGSSQNSGNRWFDKTFMALAGTHGECALYGDHSMADGTLGYTIITALFKTDSEESGFEEHKTESFAPARKLEFILDDELIQAVEDAGHHLDKLLDNYQIEERCLTSFGKTLLRRYGLSPDGCVQIALQLTYWRLYGSLPMVYEASSLQSFKLGRIEHLRTVTAESAEFVKLMNDQHSTVGDKFAKLKLALQVHKKSNTEAKQGNGMERHLFGLQCIAEENGIDASEFFDDPSWKKSSHIHIRSANIPGGMIRSSISPRLYQPHSFNIWYSIRDDHIAMASNTTEEKSALDLAKFMEILHVSLMDICDLAQKALGKESCS